jgi:hypothetical protein
MRLFGGHQDNVFNITEFVLIARFLFPQEFKNASLLPTQALLVLNISLVTSSFCKIPANSASIE